MKKNTLINFEQAKKLQNQVVKFIHKKMLKSLICMSIVCIFSPVSSQINAKPWQKIEKSLENYRKNLKIPGLSVGVVQDGKLIWSKGLGYADLRRKIKVTPNTIFHIASLTKTFTAALLLKLEEAGKLSLTDSLGKYGIKESKLKNLQIRHILSQVSDSNPPGKAYKYNSPRFELLGKVLKKATGKTFAQLVTQYIANPLKMNNTAPNINSRKDFLASKRNWYVFTQNMAKPYRLKNGVPTQFIYSHRFNTAVGMMSNIPDLSKYAQALDGDALLSPTLKQKLYQPWITSTNDTLPYAKGWFAQCYKGVQTYWHYGYGRSCSSLILRMPDKKLTVLVLANADLLSEPFSAGLGVYGDLIASPIANIFLRHFAFAKDSLPTLDYINTPLVILKKQWTATQATSFAKMYQKELLANVLLAKSTKRHKKFDELMRWYIQNNYPAYEARSDAWKAFVGRYPMSKYYVFRVVQEKNRLYYKTPASKGTGLRLYPVNANTFLLDPYTRIIFRNRKMIIQNDWDKVEVNKAKEKQK
ncbi:MAG TPA: hypothetical protein DCS93_09375 [Microscillaceae bacterium]|nr:hypothetical protein [Microscillaceae bacterium]